MSFIKEGKNDQDTHEGLDNLNDSDVSSLHSLLQLCYIQALLGQATDMTSRRRPDNHQIMHLRARRRARRRQTSLRVAVNAASLLMRGQQILGMRQFAAKKIQTHIRCSPHDSSSLLDTPSSFCCPMSTTLNGEHPPGWTLSGILDSQNEDIAYPEEISDEKPEGWDEEGTGDSKEGYCIECEGTFLLEQLLGNMLNSFASQDQPAQVLCENCQDNYCEVCFAAQHRKGTRKEHKCKKLDSVLNTNVKEVVSRNGGEEAVDEEVCSFLLHINHYSTYSP